MNFDQYDYLDVANRHAVGVYRDIYYVKEEVDAFLKKQPGEGHSCISAVVAHNDAAVELAHQRGIRIHELEQEIIKLKNSQPKKDPVRTDFEIWAHLQGLKLRQHPTNSDKYLSLRTQARWECWRTATITSLAPG
jgi:hypothetical protein